LIPNSTLLPITYSWAVGEYFPCSVTCGMGIQTRPVFCLDDTTRGGVKDTNCEIGSKPDGARSCATAVCSERPSFMIPPQATPVCAQWLCFDCGVALKRTTAHNCRYRAYACPSPPLETRARRFFSSRNLAY
jgi:hypothetical protein